MQIRSNGARQFAALALAAGLALAGTATAQSSVAALSGEAQPGDVAVVRNADTGFSHEVKVKGNGHYQMRNLPTGTYTVQIRHADGSVEPSRTVTLQVGSTARVQ
jgi:hypothetical protein